MFANSAFTADDVAATLGFPRERIVVAHPGIGAGVHGRGRGRRARRRPTCSPSRRSSRARTSARSSRRSRCSATRGSRSSSSAARAGASSRSSTGPASCGSAASSDDGARRGSTAARPSSSTRRGSRASACRSPRRWPPARRSSRRRIRRSTRPAGDAAAARRPGERRGDRGGDPRGARRGATSCARAGLEHAARLLVAADRRDLPRGVPAIRVAHRHDAAPADARGHGALPARAARPPRRAVTRGRRSRPRRALRTRRRRRCSGTRACGADGVDVLHCPTFRGPFRSRDPARRHRARPRRPAPSGVVQPLDAHVLAPRRAARRRGGRPRDRGLGVHEARARRRCSASTAAKIRVVPNAVEDVFTPDGPARRGRLRARGRHARAAQEPGADRGRRRRRAARRRRARLGRRRAAARTSPGSARSPTTELARALPRRALPRLRLALRGLRHPGRRGARLRLPGRDEPRLADGGDRGRRRGVRRPGRRRLDPRRASSGRRGPSRAAFASWAEVAAATRPSTRSSRDRPRRRRARAPPHRRRDLRARTCCASCRASRPTCASPR